MNTTVAAKRLMHCGEHEFLLWTLKCLLLHKCISRSKQQSICH